MVACNDHDGIDWKQLYGDLGNQKHGRQIGFPLTASKRKWLLKNDCTRGEEFLDSWSKTKVGYFLAVEEV